MCVCVCVKINYSVCDCVLFVMKENVNQLTKWLIEVFFMVFGQQWSSFAERKEIHHVFVSRKHSGLISVFSLDF